MRLPRIDRFDRVGTLRTGAGRVVAAAVFVARGAPARAVGMLGTPDPGAREALILAPCRAVHGIGLRAGIGAAFVDARGRVLRVVDPLPACGASCRGAVAVVEAASGVLRVAPGDHLVVTDVAGFPLRGGFSPARRGRMLRSRALSGHRGHGAPAHDRSSS